MLHWWHGMCVHKWSLKITIIGKALGGASLLTWSHDSPDSHNGHFRTQNGLNQVPISYNLSFTSRTTWKQWKIGVHNSPKYIPQKYLFHNMYIYIYIIHNSPKSNRSTVVGCAAKDPYVLTPRTQTLFEELTQLVFRGFLSQGPISHSNESSKGERLV